MANLVVNDFGTAVTGGLDAVLTNGLLSLREAVANANSDTDTTGGDGPAGAGADTITFSSPTSGGILTGALHISSDITISGPGKILSIGSTRHTEIYVEEGATLTLENVTLTDTSFYNQGTLIFKNCTIDKAYSELFGGAIYNTASGTLEVRDSVLTNNQTTNQSTTGGGAIYNEGYALVVDSLISGNSSNYGGGIYNSTTYDSETSEGIPGILDLINTVVEGNSAAEQGGGIYNRGVLNISGSSISGNRALAGGGGISGGGSMSIDGTTISGNIIDIHRQANGAGINIFFPESSLDLTNSTVSSNIGAYRGGGIYDTGGGQLNIVNTTVFGNRATKTGGGIYSFANAAISSSTVVDNIAAEAAGIWPGQSLELTNSIVAGNNGESEISQHSGVVFTGVNVIGEAGTNDANRIYEPDLTNIFETGKLEYNESVGYLLNTVAIKKGGVADGAGDASALPLDLADTDNDNDTAETLPTDARGNTFDRLMFGALDIGAYEIGYAIGDDPAFPEPNTGGPTDIIALASTVLENADGGTIGTDSDPAGQVAAVLSSIDADNPIDSHTYTIDDPSGLFEVSNNFIKVKDGVVLDFETTPSYDIEVTSTDIGGLTFTKTITINVTNYAGKYIGTNRADTQTGTSEEDVMVGKRGKDDLDGGDGEDLIRGGRGADCLTGGADADTFDFNSVKEIGKKAGKRDVIKDFEQGIDTIDLSDIDAKTPDWADKIANVFGANIHKGNQKFNFVGKKNKFSGVEGELRYEYAGNKTIIKGDTEGDGRSEFKLELTGIHVLEATDFIL